MFSFQNLGYLPSGRLGEGADFRKIDVGGVHLRIELVKRNTWGLFEPERHRILKTLEGCGLRLTLACLDDVRAETERHVQICCNVLHGSIDTDDLKINFPSAGAGDRMVHKNPRNIRQMHIPRIQLFPNA